MEREFVILENRMLIFRTSRSDLSVNLKTALTLII